MPDFRQYLTLDYWRAHRLELSYGIVALLLFFAFLFATFPYSSALESALAPLGLRFESSGQGFAFPIGAHLDNVTLRSAIEPGAQPYFKSQRIRVWPALGSLLLFHPGISASAQAYSGTLDVHVHRSGDQAVVSFDADKVNLAGLNLLRQLGAALGGEITGSGKVSIDPIAPQDDGGKANLYAKGFTIRIPGPMNSVALGDVNLTLRLEDGTIHVDQLKSSGGDVTIEGSGTIRLDMMDWHQSILALQLTLIPSATARQRLAMFMGFLPHPPGPKPYKVTGTISSPVLS